MTRVSRDIAEQLSTDAAPVYVIRGPLSRESLRLGVLTLPDEAQRIGWLLTHLNDLPGSGIIYTLTVSAAEDTATLCAPAATRCSPTPAKLTRMSAWLQSRRSRKPGEGSCGNERPRHGF